MEAALLITTSKSKSLYTAIYSTMIYIEMLLLDETKVFTSFICCFIGEPIKVWLQMDVWAEPERFLYILVAENHFVFNYKLYIFKKCKREEYYIYDTL